MYNMGYNHQLHIYYAQQNMHTEQFYGSKDKAYFTARVIALFPRWFGEKGEHSVLLYGYFRWIDDIVDNPEVPYQEKRDLLQRQRDVLLGTHQATDLHPQEKAVMESGVFSKENSTLLLQSALDMIDSFENDADHSDLTPRSEVGLIEYYQTVLHSSVEGLALLINGESVEPTYDYYTLMYYWNLIGSLKDLEEDIAAGKIQVPLSEYERKEILEIEGLEQRESAFWSFMTPERYAFLKKEAINGLKKYRKAFLSVNLPLWQRVASYAYMFRAEYKAKKKLQYPKKTPAY